MEYSPSQHAQNGGAVDRSYIEAALKRAGRPAKVDNLRQHEVAPGGSVTLLETSNAGFYFLKRLSNDRSSWWFKLIGSSTIEVGLWAEGVLENLPPPLRSPVVDISYSPDCEEWWLLMVDARQGGAYSASPIGPLLKGLASLHAQYWESSALSRLQLCPLEPYAAVYAESVAHIAGRGSQFPWAKRVAKRTSFDSVTYWLEAMDTEECRFYLDLWSSRREWLSQIAKLPQTLIHHDVHGGNFSVVDQDLVWLFDWNFAGVGPACFDVAYLSLLTHWSDWSGGQRSSDNAKRMRASYLRFLSQERAAVSDTDLQTNWDLSWLASFVQSGHTLVRSTINVPDQRAKARAIAKRAIREAILIVEKHLR